MSALKVAFESPEAFEFLNQPARYKVAYGGRGGAKSWAFADALIRQGLQKKLRVLCAREHQTSIKESVYQLLLDRIGALGLGKFYSATQTEIRGLNGTTFAFTGLRINPSDLKSFEGVDVCWVEEAHNVRKRSWDILTPTIRKPGSEIWVSFNPELDTNETYQRFVLDPPEGSVVRRVSHLDNPWFTPEMEAERRDCEKRDPDGYLTIWEGHCRVALSGAVYAKEMRDLVQRGGVTKVPHERNKPVHTAWDLGWGDQMAIILFQQVGYEYRILDYIEDRHRTVADYVNELRAKSYVYGHHYLPHDGANHNIVSGTSAEEVLRDLFQTPHVHIVPATTDDEQHAGVRNIFPRCAFDETGTRELRNRLASYRYGEHTDGSSTRSPVHDLSSHGAKAFACLAMGYAEGQTRPRVTVHATTQPGGGWMAA